MAPRNNDSNPDCGKKKNFPGETDSEVDVKDVVPCLLHKKHKVVKLVKSHIKKINEEGLFCNAQGHDAEIFIVDNENERRSGVGVNLRAGTRKVGRLRASGTEQEDMSRGSRETDGGGTVCLCLYILAFLLAVFILILLAVWISAGPLSNSMAHTPIPPGSFVSTDGLCSLERKYLLRWSKPEYFE